ncbi:MAG: proliferating cell nuclear antigen (pcna) [Candidatus Micrarchaeota archaeon]
MEITFKDAKFFKQCVDAIANLVDEGSFEISSTGIHLRSLDPSQISMVDFQLPKGPSFSGFEVEGVRNIALNLVDLSKILARSRPNEKLSVKLDDEERNKVLFEFTAESKRSFRLPLLDLREAGLPREPKTVFDAQVRIKAGVFKEMLKDASLVSSHLTLEAGDHAFVVEAHGDSGDLRIENEKSKDVEVKASAAAKAMYPAEYLDKMSKAAVEHDLLQLEFKAANPVKMTYKIGEAQLTYFLAPRVETA